MMSYNIDSVQYVRGKLCIAPAVARELLEEFEEELPEDTFLYDIDLYNPTDTIPGVIEHPSWCGTSSGNTYELLREKILPRTTGEAVLAFTWEGGDSITGLYVKDGVVTEKKIKLTLEEE